MSYKARRKVWIADKIKQFKRPGKLIDIGAGSQQWKSHCDGLEYIALDNDSYTKSDGVFDTWKAKTDIIADLNELLPISDNQYEYGLCSEVLEHLADPVSALREMMRIIKRGGTLILTAPVRCDPHMEPTIYYSGFFSYWYQYWVPKFDSSIVEIIEAERNTGIMIEIKKND